MPNDYYPPNSAARRKAKSLYALDARFLLIPLPHVLSRMTERQIQHVQKVLDAAVVNPVVKKEAADLYRRSVPHRAGSVYTVDEKTESRGDRAMEGMIWVKEDDKHIRLDFEKLLAKDALEPITDNPDEADYVKKVRNTLKEKGVWLRITQPQITNPQNFEVWLSLGYDGDAIPTKTGRLDRDAILGNQLFTAGYFKEVTWGKVQTTLEKEIDRLNIKIELGEDEHRRLINRYDNAFPGIAEISDALGGADLPSRSIWNVPNKLMSMARELNTDGNVTGTQACLVAAAIRTRNAAQLLATYAEKSTQGAAMAANIAQVVAVSSAVILSAIDATGIARGLVAEEAEAMLAARFVAKNPKSGAALDALLKEAEQTSVRVIKPVGGTGNVAGYGAGRARGL